MITATLKISLELTGPVMTKSTTQGAYGVDSPMAQSDGRYYLPGSLVKGRLREAWQELAAAAPAATANWKIDDWLGAKTGNREEPSHTFAPHRAQIYFGDFLDSDSKPKEVTATRYRIQLDEDTKAVKPGAFQVLEAPYPSGASCHFESHIRLFARDQEEIAAMTTAVRAGLRWITALGAERSVGFGAIKTVTVVPGATTAYTARPDPARGDRLALSLTFTKPVAIATARRGSNLFESDEVIPGAAIRGAIGQLLQRGLDFPDLADHLSKVRITHAFPALGQADQPRPKRFPLSFFQTADSPTLYDAALLRDPPENLAFPIDWKDGSLGPKAMNWPAVKTELRVRTAVRSDDRKQRDTALFGTRVILPQGLKWIASVDLSRVEPESTRARVAAQLAGIFAAGLPGIGKTRAFAATACTPETSQTVTRPLDGKWIVCLQTPALLLNPLRPLRTQDQLTEAYRAVWSELSGQSLHLERCFQANTLAGGDYLHRRFRSGAEYRPWLLTSPGSVFVFTEKSPAAEKWVSEWQNKGLPLPPECRAFYCDHAPEAKASELWQVCPYIPENGYGEIAVNMAEHQTYAWPGGASVRQS